MLVFGTEMHLVTFAFVSIEIVFLFYLIIFKLARPDDQATRLNVILLLLLIVYNITGGLLPDPNLPGSYFLQESIAYGTGFITPCYFIYYVYRVFELKSFKFHAYLGIYYFLVLPYLIFLLVFRLTGDLQFAQNIFLLPALYGVFVIFSMIKAIKTKYASNYHCPEARQEIVVFLFSLTHWLGLPVIDYLNLGQVLEVSVANVGFLLLFGLQVHRNVTQMKIEHTKLRETEQLLRSWNAGLQEEVNKRTNELEKINKQITNNFINLVHETKTPLTLIRNYLDEYISQNDFSNELRIVKSGIDKLTADITNLFAIERFSKGVNIYNHKRILNFSAILQNSLPLFQHYCTMRNTVLSASIEEGLTVKADPGAMNRIINNIVENAIKFTDKGGKITLSLTHRDGKVIFCVKDTGRGIPPHLQKKIFAPYYQISQKNTGHQGMGLGLPIVKNVVDGLGGKIIVKSNPQVIRGATIIIILPEFTVFGNENIIVPSDGSTANKLEYEFGNNVVVDTEFKPERHSLLLVEDNTTMVHFLFQKLSLSYNVFSALNGANAFKKLYSMPVVPDLIISDVMMERMDGFTFAKKLSEQRKFTHIPLIFLSAKSTHGDRLKGLKLGAADFISKPFSFEELRQKIDTILRNVQKQKRAVLNTSIANLNTLTKAMTNMDTIINTRPARFDNNCKLLGFTPREIEITRLVVIGKTYKEIAGDLFISERTVTKHIQNIFEKAEVSNKIALINRLNK